MPDHAYIAPRAGSAVVHAGTYRRVLPVTLERLYENVLDWERLPHLHHSSFASLRCLDAGARGWRCAATATDGRASMLELMLDRGCRRWITRVLEGPGAGTEIWTHAFPVDRERVDILVDFFLPELLAADSSQRAAAGEACARRIAGFYDADVAMMRERQRQLDRRIDGVRDDQRTLFLGPRAGLTLPMEIVLAGREFILVEIEGERAAETALVAFPRQCPHQLGPLTPEGLRGRVVRCPWHGDEFDVISGENLSGRPCRLSHLPEVHVDAQGNVRVIGVRRGQ